MKEYGGYLEWEHYSGKEYHDAYRVDSVRSALAYTINKRHYNKIYIPYYLCQCIKELISKMGVGYEYYSIDNNFYPLNIGTIKESECIFLVNFFGQLSEADIYKIKQKGNIFIDNTHCFFEKNNYGVDMANSCRKFFGLPDGGYFYTSLPMDDYDTYDYDISFNKMICNMGRFELGSAAFYEEFQINDSLERGIPCKKMSKLVNNILKSLDYQAIIGKRKLNFNVLNDALKKLNLLNVKNQAGLFLYPLLLNNSGEEVKRKLILNKIYVPTLWPGVEKLVDKKSFEKKLYNDLVLLPIDQRYDENDMNIILGRLFKVLKEVNL